MTAPTTPAPAPAAKNRIGLTKADYGGLPSTLCTGCGHDSITRHIIAAYYEMGVDPYDVVKTSGIGCSSKTPAYFMTKSMGFNSVHGRMPSLSTGAKLGNARLQVIGVSGDGDTASIGIGQYCHIIRRNLDMVYVIENNGVYGLTKGQFSATADKGSTLKSGEVNYFEVMDCCAMAIQLGCAYVARSFSGDAKQMTALLKGGIAHKGLALLDVISPCITFNNHEGSSKSFDAVKEHDVPLHELGFVPFYETPTVEMEAGETRRVDLPDGSHLFLKKLAREYDPTDKIAALRVLEEAKREGVLLTGLLYIDPKVPDLNSLSNMIEKPLAQLDESECRPPREQFEKVMARYR